ncbi:MAG: hypothetical protein N3A72_00345 [bacterium]|nr:hypothetical protein [bacterium]
MKIFYSKIANLRFRIIPLLFLLFWGILFFSIAQGQSLNLIPKDIIEGVENNDSFVKDITVLYSVTLGEPNKNVSLPFTPPSANKQLILWVRKDGKFLKEWFEISRGNDGRLVGPFHHISIFNNGTTFNCQGPYYSCSTIFSPIFDINLEINQIEHFFLRIWKNTPIKEIINQARTKTIVSTEQIKGEWVSRLKITDIPEMHILPKASAEITFNLNKGYLPIETIIFSEDKLFAKYEIEEAKEIAPGVWFPQKAKAYSFRIPYVPPANYEVINVAINKNINDSLFSLSPTSAGTRQSFFEQTVGISYDQALDLFNQISF